MDVPIQLLLASVKSVVSEWLRRLVPRYVVAVEEYHCGELIAAWSWHLAVFGDSRGDFRTNLFLNLLRLSAGTVLGVASVLEAITRNT